jgi:predicted phage terminase large subunit-like protein
VKVLNATAKELLQLDADGFAAKWNSLSLSQQKSIRAEAARIRRLIEFPSPGDLAVALDPAMVQTPALQLVDSKLVQVGEAVAVMYERRQRRLELLHAGVPDKVAIERAAEEIPSRGINRLIMSIPFQEGKGLAVDTPIATPSGWTTMGELTVGDRLFCSNGTVCTVTGAYEPRELDCYRLTFQNGSQLVADGDHLWKVQNKATGGHGVDPTWEVVNTRALLNDSRYDGVPVQSALVLPESKLLMDAYVLGVWLGDGTSDCAAMTSENDEIPAMVRERGVPCRKTAALCRYSMSDSGRSSKASTVRRQLIELGVFKNKHIPIEYLRASYEQRRDLLRGLMDTDGSVYANESGYSRCEFTTVNSRLANDVLHLTRGLGIHSKVHESRATLDGRDISARWRIRFTTSEEVFYLKRKAERLATNPGPRKRRRINGIREVLPTESVITRCIEVDSDDGTFLAGEGLIPTHNSTRVNRYGLEWLLRQFQQLRITLVSYDGVNANRLSYDVRSDIELFDGTGDRCDLGLRLMPDQKAMGRWVLRTGGGVFAIGIGGGLTGHPSDLGSIDDPLKDLRAAESVLQARQQIDWYQTTFRPRLAPWAPVMITTTRWADNDLVGQLEMKRDEARDAGAENFDDWVVVNIPAQADFDPAIESDVLGREPGEFMLSARGRTQAEWETTKNETPPHRWRCMYQGDPTPGTGTILLKEWWRYYDTAIITQTLDGTYRVKGGGWSLAQSWDFTFKDTSTSDYVVGQVWAKKGAASYLIYQVRAQLSFTDTIDALRRVARLFPQAVRKYYEDAANGPAVKSALQNEIPGLTPVKVKDSKTARAEATTAVLRAGNILLPTPAIASMFRDIAFDVAGFVDECTAFPLGTHDDQVDAYSQYVKEKYLDHGPARIHSNVGRIPGVKPNSQLSPMAQRIAARKGQA